MGRWSKDTTLWREQVLVFLPDGRYALALGIGHRDSIDGPRGAALDLVCEVPGEKWRLRYHGPARLTDANELYGRLPLEIRSLQLLDIDLVFSGSGAIWDFGDALKGESWVSFHYEQPGTLRGRVGFDGQGYALNAVAHRDHSRGSRSYTGIERGIWLQGHFPDGRSFAVLETAFAGMPEKLLARVFEGGHVFEATCRGLPTITDPDALPVDFDIIVSSELGDMAISGRIDRALPKSFDARNEPNYGTAIFTESTALIALVGPVDWTWNGVSGSGHVDLCWGPAVDRRQDTGL